MKRTKKINVKIEVSNIDSKYCGEYIFKKGKTIGSITPIIELETTTEKDCRFKRFERYPHGRSESGELPKPREGWDFFCKLYSTGEYSTILETDEIEGRFHAKRCKQCIKDFGL